MGRKKRKTKLLTGCHRCGKPWKRVSGFYKCSDDKCGHVAGSQQPSAIWGMRAIEGRVVSGKAEPTMDSLRLLDPKGRGGLRLRER